MGLLDELDPELLKMYREAAAQKQQGGSPITSGLLAAGLGMLANANRGGAQGIGMGGLMGLDAYSQAMQAQKKDPAQNLNMLSSLFGLNDKLQQSRAMREWQGAGQQQQPMQPQQPQMQGPPADMAQNFMGPPAQPPMQPPMQPQGNAAIFEGMTPGLLEKFMRSPNKTVADQASAAWDRRFKQVDPAKAFMNPDGSMGMAPGQGEMLGTINRINEQGKPFDLTKAMLNPDGSVAMRPNQGNVLGAIKGIEEWAKVGPAQATEWNKVEPTLAQRQGEDDIRAASDIVMSMRGKVPQQTTRANLVASVNGGGISPKMRQAIVDWRKNSPNEPFKYTPDPDEVPLGTGVDPAEQAALQAKRVQYATMQGDLQKTLAGDAYKTQLADLKESYKSANTAVEVLTSINESRAALAEGAITGGFGKNKIAGLNFVNGLLPASAQIAPELLGNSQRLASSLGQQLVKHAKDLGFNPSNADATRLEKVIGDEGLSEKGINAILDFQEGMGRKGVAKHNRIAQQAAEKGAAPLFDYRVEAPEPYKSKSAARPTEAAAPSSIKVGTVDQGYIFKGGDPNDKKNWLKAGR